MTESLISRRRFILTIAGATAAAAGISVPVVRQIYQTYKVALPQTPADQPDERVLRNLRAMTRAIFINYPVDLDRYQNYFLFHALNIPGYAQLYVRFSHELDSTAWAACDRPFADCEIATLRGLLNRWLTIPLTRQERLVAAVTQRESELQIVRYVIQEVMTLFMNTDAWIAIGYEAWPGMPRGLENYRKDPMQLQSG